MMTSGMAVANCDGDTNLAVHEWLCNPVTSSRRPGHRPPAQQVEVQMKYRLAPVGVGVHHHSVAPLGDAGVARHLAREPEQPPERMRDLGVVECRDEVRGDPG